MRARPAGDGNLTSVQVLRAVAALGVLLMHVRNEVVNRTGVPLPDLLIGAAGVDLFFVISGFIMLHASESLFGQRRAPAMFMLRRVGRIVPLYWLCTVATAALFVVLKWTDAAAQVTAVNLFKSLLFIPYARPDGMWWPVLELGWTLNYEMMFYAVFAVALLLRRAAAVAAVSTLFVAMVIVGSLVTLPLPFAFWCNPVILEFCFGLWIGLAWRAGWRLPSWASWSLLLGAIISLWAVFHFVPPVENHRPLLWGVPVAAAFAAVVLGPPRRQATALRRAMVFLGDASYSLYLVHFPALIVVASMSTYLRLDLASWWLLYLLVAAAAAIGASVAVALAFELPMRRAFRRFARGPDQVAARTPGGVAP